MPTVRDFLGFVVNPPPGDPTQTAMSDLLPKSAVTLPLPPPAAGNVPVSDGLGGYTWQAGAPPAGATLPASPVDGQEYYYVADATNGVIWHLKYRAASASTHKWEFVGGGPLAPTAANISGGGTTTGSWQEINTNGRVTVALAGDYDLDAWVWGINPSAGNYTMSLTTVNVAAPTVPLQTVVTTSLPAASAAYVSMAMFGRATNIPAGAVVTPAVECNVSAVAYTISGGLFRVRPVRVG